MAMGGPKDLAMVSAFLDESGIDLPPESAAHCVVGGFITSDKNWLKIIDRWCNVLDAFKIRVFHAKKFFALDDRKNRVGEYKGWGDAKANSFINGLIDSLGTTTPRLVCSAVKTKDFNGLSYGERKFVTGGMPAIAPDSEYFKWYTTGAPSKPYFFALRSTFVESLNSSKQLIHFIHDRQNLYEPYAHELARVFRIGLGRGMNRLFGSLVFEDKERIPPLQLADLLCYLANRNSIPRKWEQRHDDVLKRLCAATRGKVGPVVWDDSTFHSEFRFLSKATLLRLRSEPVPTQNSSKWKTF
jgi:hypothetical protein